MTELAEIKRLLVAALRNVHGTGCRDLGPDWYQEWRRQLEPPPARDRPRRSTVTSRVASPADSARPSV
jgi:hypothetical protein